MTPLSDNLFKNIPQGLQQELFQTLVEADSIRIEQIVSYGQATPQGEWLDQEWDEWVLLISGRATLLFDTDSTPLKMESGDHIMIPAGSRHRVEETAAGQNTIWLAVHFKGKISG